MKNILTVVRNYIGEYVFRVPGVLFCLICLAATIFSLYHLPQGEDLLLVELKFDSERPWQRALFLLAAIFFTFALYFSLRLSADYIDYHKGKGPGEPVGRAQNDDAAALPHHVHHIVPVVISSLWLAIIAFISMPAISGNENKYVAGLGGVLVFIAAGSFLYFVADRLQHQKFFERTITRVTGISQFKHLVLIYAILYGLLFFVLTLLIIGNHIQIGSAAAVFLSLGIILVIGACLGVYSAIIKLPILFAVIIVVAFVALNNDKKGHYSVGRRAGISEYKENLPPRKKLSDEYELWLGQLKRPGPGPGPGPVMLLVAAQGGASRAGAWTGAVLAELDRRTEGQARKHIFAINAVSGGAVGAAGYVAHVRLGTPHDALHEPLKKLTGSDSLSPTINSMMFPNLLAQLYPHPRLPDRAAALETAWEEAWNASSPNHKDQFGRGFVSFNTSTPAENTSTPAEWVPILIVQGAQLETGRRILTSRINFQADGATDVNAEDFYALANREIRVSTAIHNGARFPYLSPVGVIETKDQNVHIVDGGYFDQTGVETIRELGRSLKKEDESLIIKYLIIKYEGEERKPRFAMPNEMFGPMRALLSSRDGHAAHIMRGLGKENDDGSVVEVILKDCVKQKEGEARVTVFNVPMNWVLSERVQDYIQDAAKEKTSANFDECMSSGASDKIESLVGQIYNKN